MSSPLRVLRGKGRGCLSVHACMHVCVSVFSFLPGQGRWKTASPLSIQAPTPMNIFAANKEKGKTFRPRRNHREGTKRYQLHKFAQVCSRPDCGLCFVCVCVCRGCREGNAHRVGAAARRPRSARATFTRL